MRLLAESTTGQFRRPWGVLRRFSDVGVAVHDEPFLIVVSA
jgi:hypothetical protein